MLPARSRPKQTEADAQTAQIGDALDAASNDPKLQLLITIVEAMTGRKIDVLSTEDIAPQPQQPIPDGNRPAPQGWGLEYDRHEVYYEAEQLSFSAQGVINTADGQTVEFDLQLEITREYYRESNVSIRAGDAVKKDPLVINFAGTAAQLTDTKFAFDLAGTGTKDDISFIRPGSGFLTLDRNGNGNVDNGSELFGTRSGDGFADLAQYDQDANQWIDANDSIFGDLRVWSKDSQGADLSVDVGGARCRRAVPGSRRNAVCAEERPQRSARASPQHGRLFKDGGAGTLQQVDLAI